MVNKYNAKPVTPDVSTKDPMVEYVVKEFNRYESFHSQRFDEAWKIYDQWIGKAPPRAFNWQNAVHVPITFEGEQTITPRLFGALFPDEAPLDVRVEGDVEMTDGIPIKHTIQHYFRVSNVQGKALPAMTQNTLLGTGYLEASWLVQRKWQEGTAGEFYSAITANRPDCASVNFFEIFPHPSKLHMCDGLPLIRKRYCDAEYLKSLKDNPYFETSNIDKALQSESTIMDKSKVLGSDGHPIQTSRKGEYEILEYWGPWDE